MKAAACLMLEYIAPAWLAAFADMIKVYDEKYGHECWPLLYQMLCRFETEHMTRMMRRESELQDDALLRYGRAGQTPYNPKYPFDYLYFLATTKKPAGAQEKE